MNLFETLKQFKNIHPNASFSETSRRAILAFEPGGVRVWGIRRTILKIIETGAAVALTGFFVLLITGALSSSRLTPQYSAIDTQSLRAEAQAIDIQIELANLNYSPLSGGPSTESTLATVSGGTSGKGTATPETIYQISATAPVSTSTTSTVSIDDALRSLSQ